MECNWNKTVYSKNSFMVTRQPHDFINCPMLLLAVYPHICLCILVRYCNLRTDARSNSTAEMEVSLMNTNNATHTSATVKSMLQSACTTSSPPLCHVRDERGGCNSRAMFSRNFNRVRIACTLQIHCQLIEKFHAHGIQTWFCS